MTLLDTLSLSEPFRELTLLLLILETLGTPVFFSKIHLQDLHILIIQIVLISMGYQYNIIYILKLNFQRSGNFPKDII